MEAALNYWDELLKSMRPKHWTKNILVFAGVVFAQQLGQPMALSKSVIAFVSFCMLSSAGYLFNDVLDREKDVLHPVKKTRPIARGVIGPAGGVFWWIAFTALGMILGIALGEKFLVVAGAFAAINFFYSLWLKHVVIVDAFAIAALFVLRTVAGPVAISVPMSSWLLICSLLLALFLGLTKRSLEMKLLEEDAPNHRPSLAEYNPYLLDQMSAVITSALLIAYTLYTLSPSTVSKFEGHGLFITVPVVLYGIFRYLYLVHQKQVVGTLENALVSDKPMMIAVVVYVITAFVAVYI